MPHASRRTYLHLRHREDRSGCIFCPSSRIREPLSFLHPSICDMARLLRNPSRHKSSWCCTTTKTTRCPMQTSSSMTPVPRPGPPPTKSDIPPPVFSTAWFCGLLLDALPSLATRCAALERMQSWLCFCLFGSALTTKRSRENIKRNDKPKERYFT